jgi:hypothetical protein
MHAKDALFIEKCPFWQLEITCKWVLLLHSFLDANQPMKIETADMTYYFLPPSYFNLWYIHTVLTKCSNNLWLLSEVTSYTLGGRSSISDKFREPFLFIATTKMTLRSTQLPNKWFPETDWVGRQSDHSSASSVKSDNWYTLPPYALY